MKFRVKCHIFLGLVFVLQLNQTAGKTQEELALFMQKNVESLIEKILTQVQEYYNEIKLNAKCIPDFVPDEIMETLKKSIDCVSENEKKYSSNMINQKRHLKNFLNCFSKAKEEVNLTMTAIDPYEDYCPQNITEKTYEINVTTTFVKTFQINIKNGLEVAHKKIDFGRGNCLNSNAIYGTSSQNNHGSVDDKSSRNNHENDDDKSSQNNHGNDDDNNDENDHDYNNDKDEYNHEYDSDSDEHDDNDNTKDKRVNENKHETVTNNKNKPDRKDNESDQNPNDSDEEDGMSSDEGSSNE